MFKQIKKGSFLPNGAKVVQRKGEFVLARYRKQYAIWEIDSKGNAFSGDYTESIYRGRQMLDARYQMRKGAKKMVSKSKPKQKKSSLTPAMKMLRMWNRR